MNVSRYVETKGLQPVNFLVLSTIILLSFIKRGPAPWLLIRLVFIQTAACMAGIVRSMS